MRGRQLCSSPWCAWSVCLCEHSPISLPPPSQPRGAEGLLWALCPLQLAIIHIHEGKAPQQAAPSSAAAAGPELGTGSSCCSHLSWGGQELWDPSSALAGSWDTSGEQQGPGTFLCCCQGQHSRLRDKEGLCLHLPAEGFVCAPCPPGLVAPLLLGEP